MNTKLLEHIKANSLIMLPSLLYISFITSVYVAQLLASFSPSKELSLLVVFFITFLPAILLLVKSFETFKNKDYGDVLFNSNYYVVIIFFWLINTIAYIYNNVVEFAHVITVFMLLIIFTLEITDITGFIGLLGFMPFVLLCGASLFVLFSVHNKEDHIEHWLFFITRIATFVVSFFLLLIFLASNVSTFERNILKADSSLHWDSTYLYSSSQLLEQKYISRFAYLKFRATRRYKQ